MKTLSYYKFLWKSVNAHNVHSPFVFGIATKALSAKNIHFPPYKKESGSFLSKKAVNVLCRIIFNLKREKLFVVGDNSGAITETIRTCGEYLNMKLWFFSPLAPIPGTIDLVYIEPENKENILQAITQLLPNIGENSICVVDNIHSSTEAEQAWEKLKADPRVTVTIDTYHLGLAFFRKGQVKEHFMIRTTTSKFTDFVLGARKLWGLLY